MLSSQTLITVSQQQHEDNDNHNDNGSDSDSKNDNASEKIRGKIDKIKIRITAGIRNA